MPFIYIWVNEFVTEECVPMINNLLRTSEHVTRDCIIFLTTHLIEIFLDSKGPLAISIVKR